MEIYEIFSSVPKEGSKSSGNFENHLNVLQIFQESLKFNSTMYCRKSQSFLKL